ncbi:hypothetical protein DRJ25_02525 [Candidatus Woesearchaeota archaeon]|nr:MAG: hypothetical protein DRJ25_02525 [Candidatus Woesearchaeota archaeon]
MKSQRFFETKDFEILIYSYPLNSNIKYTVRIFKKYNGISMIYKSKSFKTMSAAIRFAKKWVKKHSNLKKL